MRNFILLGLLLALSLSLPAWAGENPDYEKAKEKAAQVAESLQSYEITAQLTMEQKPVGAAQGMKFEATQKAAARMPDRLLVSIESPMFQQSWGTGAENSWFFFSQQQVCYMGQPTELTRTLQPEEAQGLDPTQIYNFYAGVGEYLLSSDVLVAAETGSEQVTVNGKEITCQAFNFQVLEDDGVTPKGHGSYLFDPESGLVLQASVTTISNQNGMEMEGTMSSIISSFVLNGQVPDEQFTYQPANGVKIVDSFDRLLNPDSMVGEAAPDISFTTFDGQTVNLRDYRGKVVFLDFWATWCGPCRMEMPHIQALHDEMKDSGEVIFIGASNEDQKTIENWLQKNPYTFKMVMVKPEDAQSKYKVTSIPAGFVIDREGIIRAHMIGAQSEMQLRTALGKAGIK
jgi:thiol-disulfide isomerase/thioredoxin/outer membrane lipoprotein-sorting protein